MKKVLSVIIVTAMLLSLFPMSVFASDTVQVGTWADLQSEINNAIDYTEKTITLSGNVTAGEQDIVISVSDKDIIVLDLNGYTLNRGLTEATKNSFTAETKSKGYVIMVDGGGTLKIIDSSDISKNGSGSGKICGGVGGIFVRSNGSCTLESGSICNNFGSGVVTESSANENYPSIFLMHGGSITGNKADENGGGIYNSGQLVITGGRIFGNEAFRIGEDGPVGFGGGIYSAEPFTLINAEVSGNYAGRAGGGIFAYSGMTVGGEPDISGNTSGGDDNKVGAKPDNIALQYDVSSGCPKITMGDGLTVTYTTVPSGSTTVPAFTAQNIGVSVVKNNSYDEIVPLDGVADVEFLSSSDENDVVHFVSENDNYVIKAEGNETVFAPKPIFNLCNGVSLRDTGFPSSAVYGDYELVGWYTERTGGTPLEEVTNDDRGKTFYAHWKDPASGKLVLCEQLNIEDGALKIGLEDNSTPITEFGDFGSGFGTDFTQAFGISYDNDSNTLTLDNASIMPFYPYSIWEPCGIASDQDLNIKLVGSNHIGNPVSIEPNDPNPGNHYNEFGAKYGIACWSKNLSFTGDSNSSLTISDQAEGIRAKNVTFGDEFEGSLTISDLGASFHCAINAMGNVEILSGNIDLTSYMSTGINAASRIHIGGDSSVNVSADGGGLACSDYGASILIDGEADLNIVSRSDSIYLYNDSTLTITDSVIVRLESTNDHAIYADESSESIVNILGGASSLKVSEESYRVISSAPGKTTIGDTAVIANESITPNYKNYDGDNPADIITPVDASQPVVIVFEKPVNVSGFTMSQSAYTYNGNAAGVNGAAKSVVTVAGSENVTNSIANWKYTYFETKDGGANWTMLSAAPSNAGNYKVDIEPDHLIYVGKQTIEFTINPKVTLQQGGNVKYTASSTSLPNSFSFGGQQIQNGTYNLVMEFGYKTITEIITFGSGIEPTSIDIPDESVSSLVETGPNTPEVVVGNLIQEAEDNAQEGKDVSLKMTVESKDVSDLPSAQVNAIKALDEAQNKTIEFLDIYIKKYVSGESPVDIHDTANLITIVVPVQTDGRKNFSVYRYHDENGDGIVDPGEAIAFTQLNTGESPAENTYYVDKSAGTITIYTKKFSAYALGYETESGGGHSGDGGSSAGSYVAPKKCPQDETCVYAHFTDADPKAWYHDGVHYCVENKYMNGFTDKIFQPKGTLSRAQIVMILWNIEGHPNVDYDMSFKDVVANAWNTEAIRWAQSTGVVEGYNAESFGPNDNVTREQLAAILMRYAKYKGIDVSARADLAKFADADKISSWALENVKWANAVGIINGRTTTTIVPKGDSTRAEAACMVQRFCENILKK